MPKWDITITWARPKQTKLTIEADTQAEAMKKAADHRDLALNIDNDSERIDIRKAEVVKTKTEPTKPGTGG